MFASSTPYHAASFWAKLVIASALVLTVAEHSVV